MRTYSTDRYQVYCPRVRRRIEGFEGVQSINPAPLSSKALAFPFMSSSPSEPWEGRPIGYWCVCIGVAAFDASRTSWYRLQGCDESSPLLGTCILNQVRACHHRQLVQGSALRGRTRGTGMPPGLQQERQNQPLKVG